MDNDCSDDFSVYSNDKSGYVRDDVNEDWDIDDRYNEGNDGYYDENNVYNDDNYRECNDDYYDEYHDGNNLLRQIIEALMNRRFDSRSREKRKRKRH